MEEETGATKLKSMNYITNRIRALAKASLCAPAPLAGPLRAQSKPGGGGGRGGAAAKAANDGLTRGGGDREGGGVPHPFLSILIRPKLDTRLTNIPANTKKKTSVNSVDSPVSKTTSSAAMKHGSSCVPATTTPTILESSCGKPYLARSHISKKSVSALRSPSLVLALFRSLALGNRRA